MFSCTCDLTSITYHLLSSTYLTQLNICCMVYRDYEVLSSIEWMNSECIATTGRHGRETSCYSHNRYDVEFSDDQVRMRCLY